MGKEQVLFSSTLLPFISAGGTSLMVFMGAIGVLCNVGNNGERKRVFTNNKLYGKIINGKKRIEIKK